MEHRRGMRKPLVADVVIQNNEQKPIFGQTRNISLGGMFVDTKHTKLPVNAFVKVTVFQVVNKQRESFCTPAFVIHNEKSGAGLMFINPNPAKPEPKSMVLLQSRDLDKIGGYSCQQLAISC